MGCASSNPIVQGGKQFVESAKDSVTDAVHKSEHMLHDAGEVAKEGIEDVKEAIGAAVTTAEAGIGSIVEKVGNTFSSGQKEATEAAATVSEQIQNETKETANAAETVVTETISNVVETIPTAAVSSELDDAKDFVLIQSNKLKKEMSLTDEFGEIVAADSTTLDDASLRVEDLEDTPATLMNTIDSNYKDMKKKAEDLMTNNDLQQQSEQDRRQGSPKKSPPTEEQRLTKEEPAPTFWEAAADAILQQKLRQAAHQVATYRFEDDEADEDDYKSELQHHRFHHSRTPTDTEDADDFLSDLSKKSERSRTVHHEELFEKEHIRPPEIIINSENLSIKSYKSEI